MSVLIDYFLQHPLLAALLALVTLCAVFGAILGFASIKFKVEGNPIVDQIDKLGLCSTASDDTTKRTIGAWVPVTDENYEKVKAQLVTFYPVRTAMM